MLRVNGYGFYHRGKSLAPLAAIQEPTTVGAVLVPLFFARSEIRALLTQNIVLVRTCRREGENLIAAISAVVSQEDFTAGITVEVDKEVSGTEIPNIKNTLSRFEAVLNAELAIATTFSVPPRGLYNISDLIDNAEVVVSESLRGILPQQALEDLRQSGRCIAFAIPTASAFHVLRAAEAVIKEYWETLVGKKWPYKKRDWGMYIENLTKAGAAPKITNALDQIRQIHRNPIMHPEDSLNLDDAISLFGMVNGVIVLMLQEIKAKATAAKVAVAQEY